MARIRTIKPDFWTDEKIVQLPYEARLLFIGLWNFADDDGRLYEEPERIRMQILPNEDVDAALVIDLLVAVGLCDRHIIDGNKSVLVITHFADHQKISNKTPSRIPLEKSRKLQITTAMRRSLATKYGCVPGGDKDASCYYCGSPGSMRWWPLNNGKPSSWVSFSALEIDHFVAESQGGPHSADNLVLACRECNRSKGARDGVAFVSSSFPENSVVLTHGREGNGRDQHHSLIAGETFEGFEDLEDPLPEEVPLPVDPKAPVEMTLDWMPAANLLKTYCAHFGVSETLFTKEAVAPFTAHHETQGSLNTQAKWVSLLVRWVKGDSNRASNVRPFPVRRQTTEPDFDSTAWAEGLVVTP